MMLPEDMRLWVGKDHLVWFVIDVIGGLDITALEALGRPGKGRPGYDPRMMAVLLIYACLQAERSSRKIEERCRTDAAFRVATGNRVPDHLTICRFRAAAACEGGPLEDLFTRVLFVLAVAGLGRLDVAGTSPPGGVPAAVAEQVALVRLEQALEAEQVLAARYEQAG